MGAVAGASSSPPRRRIARPGRRLGRRHPGRRRPRSGARRAGARGGATRAGAVRAVGAAAGPWSPPCGPWPPSGRWPRRGAAGRRRAGPREVASPPHRSPLGLSPPGPSPPVGPAPLATVPVPRPRGRGGDAGGERPLGRRRAARSPRPAPASGRRDPLADGGWVAFAAPGWPRPALGRPGGVAAGAGGDPGRRRRPSRLADPLAQGVDLGRQGGHRVGEGCELAGDAALEGAQADGLPLLGLLVVDGDGVGAASGTTRSGRRRWPRCRP